MEQQLTHLSLFSGIGGFDLASEWAGFTTVGMCEKNPYCRYVLRKHWPQVHIWEDVHEVTGDKVATVAEGGIDLLTGGFPCQPFSNHGKRLSTSDPRHLWPEMSRIIREVRPSWVVGENVSGFVSLALDLVASDLEEIGYKVIPFAISASCVGARHQRERIFMVAHSPIKGLEGAAREALSGGSLRSAWMDFRSGTPNESRFPFTQLPNKPGVLRVLDGVPHRVDRIAALGNALVPQQVYPILKAISAIEYASRNANP